MVATIHNYSKVNSHYALFSAIFSHYTTQLTILYIVLEIPSNYSNHYGKMKKMFINIASLETTRATVASNCTSTPGLSVESDKSTMHTLYILWYAKRHKSG